jgi:hypothetical protein
MLNDIEASISFENLTNPKHRDGRLHHCNLERKEKILALRKPILGRAPTSEFPFIIRTASSASSFFSKVIFITVV